MNYKPRERPKLTTEDFQAFFGSPKMGPLAQIIYPLYFWWMSDEIKKVKSPEDCALIHATPRAQTFWTVCGFVLAIPFVLVIMWLLHDGL